MPINFAVDYYIIIGNESSIFEYSICVKKIERGFEYLIMYYQS